MSFVSIIHFKVKPGRAERFERAFADAGMLERPLAHPGCLGVRFLKSTVDEVTYSAIAGWSSRDAYEHWQKRSLGDLSKREVDGFLDTLADAKPGMLYEVIDESAS